MRRSEIRARPHAAASSDLAILPWTPFSPFTDCVMAKSTASEQS